MLRIGLVCVGRVKDGPERLLADRYMNRAGAAGRPIGLDVELREIAESRARRPDDRRAAEAAAIRAQIGAETPLIALDETGVALDSVAFARLLGTTRDRGTPLVGVAVGGADGLDDALRRGAVARIAFGAMTWPHQLVRIMAAEQIYRAITILSGHPYHRA